MSRKRHKPEEIVAKLRQVEVLVAQGTPVADAVRSIGVTEVASGRVAGWGDLLLSAGGPSCDRELETSLQCPAPPCLARLPPAGSGGVRARLCCMAGCAHPTSSAGHALGGAQANPELTFNPDHQLGADHKSDRASGPGAACLQWGVCVQGIAVRRIRVPRRTVMDKDRVKGS